MGEWGEARRTVAFFDGQNFYHDAREAFGRVDPDYDPLALARAVCRLRGWELRQVRFYTGIPELRDDPFWYGYWSAKLSAMGWAGIKVYSRTLAYRRVTVRLPGGGTYSFRTRQEKGIDVRIAIDVIRMAGDRQYDVALLFSRDQDLSEVAREIRDIARSQRRWIKIASAFPRGTGRGDRPGIDLTDWIPIDRATYEACLDPVDHRRRGRTHPPG